MHFTDEQLRIIRLSLHAQCWVATIEEKEKINKLLSKIEKKIFKGEESEHRTNDTIGDTKKHIDTSVNESN
jgi:hypothetical protein